MFVHGTLLSRILAKLGVHGIGGGSVRDEAELEASVARAVHGDPRPRTINALNGAARIRRTLLVSTNPANLRNRQATSQV